MQCEKSWVCTYIINLNLEPLHKITQKCHFLARIGSLYNQFKFQINRIMLTCWGLKLAPQYHRCPINLKIKYAIEVAESVSGIFTWFTEWFKTYFNYIGANPNFLTLHPWLFNRRVYRWNPSAFRVYLQFAKPFCRWFCTADWLCLFCYHFSIISPLLRPLVHRLSGISISFSPIICFDFPPPSDARSIFPQPALPALCVLCLMGCIGWKPPASKEVKLAHLRDHRQHSASGLVSFLWFPFAP